MSDMETYFRMSFIGLIIFIVGWAMAPQFILMVFFIALIAGFGYVAYEKEIWKDFNDESTDPRR